MLLRSRIVLPMTTPPLLDGAVRVSGNRITDVGPAAQLQPRSGEEVLDLGSVALLPGLVNAHCHLDYSSLRHSITAPAGFTEWVQRLNSIKRQLSNDDILDAIRRGYAEAQRFGTTTICSMAAFPDLIPQLPPARLRTWWFYEMIDIRHRNTSDEVVAGALSFFDARRDDLTQFGLNPHAPYTASLLLYRLAWACAQQNGMPLTTHVSESLEESEMFEKSSGPLYAFLEGLQRPMHDCGHDTPFGWLWRNGAIGGAWLLAHLNDLKASDFALLDALPKDRLPNVVHCPGSHAYFKHPPFPFSRLAGMGVNISVGTDSLASTDSLSLLSELRKLQIREPGLSSEDLLHTVTLAPARALGKAGELGCISSGALADLIAMPCSGSLDLAAAECIAHTGPVSWMMVDGKVSDFETI